ncbi:MAG: HEAT repeat domain-containing protein [Armatimonadota bacterium]
MSRWLLALFLAGSLVSVGFFPSVITPARADDFSIDFGGGNKDDNKDTTTTTTTDTDTDTTTTEDENTSAKREVLAKADIRSLVTSGKHLDAEKAYLEWASYWRQDDPRLIAPIERAILLQQYRDGSFASLVSLVRVGDVEAANLLRSTVLSGSKDLPSAELATAVGLLGERGDRSTLNTLRIVLYHEDKAIVNAAIEALGNLGDRRIVPELMSMFEKADAEQSINLARALVKLGAAREVQKRFEPQLRFPLPGVREKAALVLATVGSPAGWVPLKQMLTTKDAAYYPIALSVLGGLPSEESVAFINQALIGDEAEQMAAIKSINLLPAQELGDTLVRMLLDVKRPINVRLAVLDILVDAKYGPAVKEIRNLAAYVKPENAPAETVVDPQLKAAALLAMPKLGLLSRFSNREMVRQQLDNAAENADDEVIARAARTALFSYGVKPVVAAK